MNHYLTGAGHLQKTKNLLKNGFVTASLLANRSENQTEKSGGATKIVGKSPVQHNPADL